MSSVPAGVSSAAQVDNLPKVAISRQEVFAGLVLLGFANGISERIVVSLSRDGVAGALLNTFDISAIVWGACLIGTSFLVSEKGTRPDRADWIVATIALAAILLPVVPLSWLVITGLMVYLLRNSPRTGVSRRGMWILLAITVPMFWARILFAAFSDEILSADAALVGWLVGADRIGNAVAFTDASGYLWVAPSCSSLANVSLCVLCWVTINEFLGRRSYLLRDVWWVLAASAAVVVINVVRLSLILSYRDYFDLIHGPIGATIAGLIILCATVAICWLGVRRDLPAMA